MDKHVPLLLQDSLSVLRYLEEEAFDAAHSGRISIYVLLVFLVLPRNLIT